MNVKKIVAAVDGSEVSMAAFGWALDLAALIRAELVVVTVSDRRTIEDEGLYPAFLSDRKVKELIEEYDEKGRGIFKDIRNRCEEKGVKISTVVLHGLPSEEIVGLAADEGADLIVMGAHGKKEEFYHEFSSTSERVLKKSPCPVLMIVPERDVKRAEHKGREPRPYKPILHST
jgi:nucleotide-binding universal stress UspA family protein